MSLLNSLQEIQLPTHGFQYKEFKEIEGNYVISPSSARNFLDNRAEWKSATIDKAKTFTGNANTRFGSLMHLYAERYYQGKLSKEFKLSKLDLEAFFRSEPSYAMEHDSDYFDMMCTVFRNDYLKIYPQADDIEGYIQVQISDNILLAGSYDTLSLENDVYVLTDFKTTSSSSKDIESHYLQLAIYALALKKERGIDVGKFRIVQLVKNKQPKVNVIEDDVKLDIPRKILNRMIFSLQDYPNLTDEQKDAYYGDNIFSFTSDTKLGVNPRVVTNEKKKIDEIKNNIFG